METVNDIRREEGNPRAGDPTAGPFLIQGSFRKTGSGVRMFAVLLMVMSAVVIAAGVFSLVFPIAIVGVVGLVGAVVLFWQAENLADLTKVK
jgi:Flp pilus assembly protein TadB